MKWLDVNGAKIEEEFLNQNIAEANEVKWTPFPVADIKEHVHCMVCNCVLSNVSRPDSAFTSSIGHLCNYCHERFVKAAN